MCSSFKPQEAFLISVWFHFRCSISRGLVRLGWASRGSLAALTDCLVEVASPVAPPMVSSIEVYAPIIY